MAKAPIIGTHLAALNLFREPDGTVEITVADSRGAIAEMTSQEKGETRPIDYLEPLIFQAADRMKARHTATGKIGGFCPNCGAGNYGGPLERPPTKTDPRTGWPIGNHGKPNDAIDYAIEVVPTESRDFLHDWREGNLKSWPDFYSWLAEREERNGR